MENVAIIGVGRMGTAIAWAMNKLGWRVSAVDSNPDSLHELSNVIGEHDAHFCQHSQVFEKVLRDKKPEVVISSLPYHENESLARICISNGIRYCDLGGRVDVSRKINVTGLNSATKPIMTDLGLAPGWVNILAERGCAQLRRPTKKIEMMVGGLPVMPRNPPLNYLNTWSIEGLINEYKDDCEVLADGEIITVKGMDGLSSVKINTLDKELESFYTSGGASHTLKDMKARGVRDCSYKTLRYKGHQEIVKFLIRDCELTGSCLNEIFNKGCAPSENAQGKDLVVIKVKVSSEEKVSWEQEILVHAGEYKTEFSAMQQATAFPVAAVASLMAEGHFDKREIEHRGYKEKLPVVLTYKDVPFEKFNENLKLLGIGV